MIDFDIILAKIGGSGRAQVLLFFIIGYTAVISGFNTMSPVFINFTPDYRCDVPASIVNATLDLSESEILQLTTPLKTDGSYDTCHRYVVNEGCTAGAVDELATCIDSSAEPVTCDSYHYDTSVFSETVITEFNLICDDKYLDGLATSLYMVGILVGSMIFGIVSDKFGRRPVMLGSSIAAFSCLFASAFSHQYVWFVFARVLLAAFGFGIFLSSFVYLTEVCENNWRSYLGIGYQSMFSVGYMTLSGLAYNWRSWHELTFVSALFCLPFAFVMFFIPESPRWLFSVGKTKQAKVVTRRFARVNGTEIDEETLWIEAERGEEMKGEEEEQVQASLLDLFRTRPMRVMTFKSMFNWFVNNAIYYGISLNVNALEGSIFVNNTINGVVEVAGYIFLIVFMERIGRRWMLTGMLSLAGISLLVSTVCAEFGSNNEGAATTGLVFSFVAKFGSAAAFAVIYNLTSELFPTVIRMQAVGVSSVVGRLGSIIAPMLVGLQDTVSWLPNTILGVLGVVGAVISLSFPETTGIDMMATVEEAEDFYQGKRHGNTNKGFIEADGTSSGSLETEFQEKL